MNTYFSTFVSGFSEIVRKNLSLIIKELEVIKLLDGLIVYKTETAVGDIRKVRFLNNSFVLLKLLENHSLEEAATKVLEDKVLQVKIKAELVAAGKTFRIIMSNENQIVALDKNTALELEDMLSNSLTIDKANPDIELWFLERSEGDCFVGVRITRPEAGEKYLRRGELKPELSHLLCLLSEPTSHDIFLDPFAGSGAIVMERSKYFPYTKIFAGEFDKQVFKKLQERVENTAKIVLGRWNAVDLSSLTTNSVSKIVTDPPWGFYKNENENLEGFYQKMLSEFSRVLLRGGIVVVLMGQKEAFGGALKVASKFDLLEKLDILVSGKKASVYKIRKN